MDKESNWFYVNKIIVCIVHCRNWFKALGNENTNCISGQYFQKPHHLPLLMSRNQTPNLVASNTQLLKASRKENENRYILMVSAVSSGHRPDAFCQLFLNGENRKRKLNLNPNSNLCLFIKTLGPTNIGWVIWLRKPVRKCMGECAWTHMCVCVYKEVLKSCWGFVRSERPERRPKLQSSFTELVKTEGLLWSVGVGGVE